MHVLVQKMAVNVDLGFILSIVDFFSLSGSDPLFQVCMCEELNGTLLLTRGHVVASGL